MAYTNSKEYAEKLFNENYKLIFTACSYYGKDLDKITSYLSREDVEQIAAEALYIAALHFNPAYGYAFSTYAFKVIKTSFIKVRNEAAPPKNEKTGRSFIYIDAIAENTSDIYKELTKHMQVTEAEIYDESISEITISNLFDKVRSLQKTKKSIQAIDAVEYQYRTKCTAIQFAEDKGITKDAAKSLLTRGKAILKKYKSEYQGA